MGKGNYTPSDIIQAVAMAAGTTPNKLKVKGKRSTKKMQAAKLVATDLLLRHTKAKRPLILSMLGYSTTGVKQINYNRTALIEKLNNKDSLVIGILENAKFQLNKDGGGISIATAKDFLTMEVRAGKLTPAIQKAARAGKIYPFVMQIGGISVELWGVGGDGKYYGQSFKNYTDNKALIMQSCKRYASA